MPRAARRVYPPGGAKGRPLLQRRLPRSDRPNRRGYPRDLSLRVHPTGLGQLNSSNPKEMSWRKRMAHLLTTEKGTSSVSVMG